MPEEDLREKGLNAGSVGLLASVVLGISSVAPAYALTATLGPTVTEVGLQMPAIFLAGFLPMLLVAYSDRELNKVIPDCGTSFTWTAKAFGPHAGWRRSPATRPSPTSPVAPGSTSSPVWPSWRWRRRSPTAA